MTVNSVDITDGPYIGNGVAEDFDYSFSLQSGDGLLVYETDLAGNQALLVEDVDYFRNIDGGGNGSITRADGPLPIGWQIYIRSDFKATQLTSFSSQGAFFPELHEKAVDKLTYLIQQVNDKASRSLHYPDSYADGVNGALLPEPESQKLIRWRSDLLGFENIDISLIDPDAVVLNDYVKKIDNVASLSSFTPIAGVVYKLKEYITGTNKGGGDLLAKVGVITPNNVTTFAGPGVYYFERINYDVLTVHHAGAVGNGTVDDTAAIQRAINYLTNTTFATTWVSGSPVYTKGGGTLLFPSGVYRTTSTLKVGQHVRLLGVSTSGFFYPYLTTSGSCIYADFSGNAWVIDTANYTSAGVAPGYRDSITGVQLDAGTYNSCHGVQIENLLIYTASSLYGGIRLNGAPNSNISNCGVYGTDINYFVASSWGVTLSNIKGIFYLYGCFAAPDCNSLKISGYLDGTGAKTISDANRPTQMFKDDFDVANGFPSALYNKRAGFLCYYNNGVIADGLTTEHADFGRIVVRTPGYTDTASYVEACNDGYFAIATSSGTITSMFQFNPAITNGWVFGQVANMSLQDCPASGVLADATCNVKIVSADPEGDGWKYYDALTYVGAKIGTIRVSSAGVVSNFANKTNYTTLDEALRRISVSPQQAWTIVINGGDTVSLGAVRNIVGKTIRFIKESGATPTLLFSVSAGSPFYMLIEGTCELSFDQVNISYTGATSPSNITIASGFFLAQDKATNLTLSFNLSTIALQTAWALIQQGFNSANSVTSTFSGCAITGSGTARIHSTALANTGGTVVINHQFGCSVSASIKAIGTNGWENATIVSSNF